MKTLYQLIKRRREADGLSTNAGFTLIELLIVIVVLGILAGVVIFALGGVTGKSAVAACQADGATVSTAISAFNAQNPGTTVTQGTSGTNGGLLGNGGAGDVGGPYLQSWPSNLPHYAFAIADSTKTYNGLTAPTPGTLLIDVGTTASSHGDVTGSLSGDLWAVYSGPSACASVA